MPEVVGAGSGGEADALGDSYRHSFLSDFSLRLPLRRRSYITIVLSPDAYARVDRDTRDSRQGKDRTPEHTEGAEEIILTKSERDIANG